MKKSVIHQPASMRDFERRADQILADLQKTLLPDHAQAIIAINVATGEYLLSHDLDKAWDTFRERWPSSLAYVTRVDGGPVVKFHGIA
jgi:hypothetical protein